MVCCFWIVWQQASSDTDHLPPLPPPPLLSLFRYPVDLRVKFLASFLKVFGESDEKDKQEVIDAKQAYEDAKRELAQIETKTKSASG